ncbi:MAG: D-aminoacyl-tRNA deacylase [Dehalococcoidia bacterium]
MRAVVQRVLRARVTVDDRVVGEIGGEPVARFLILAGVHRDDTEAEAALLARKISQLRVFPDEAGRMNRSLEDLGGESLVVSQFTLFADLRKGRRPSFFDAAPPEQAIPLLDLFCRSLSGTVRQGEFGARMHVELVNDGPVTILLDTDIWTRTNSR